MFAASGYIDASFKWKIGFPYLLTARYVARHAKFLDGRAGLCCPCALSGLIPDRLTGQLGSRLTSAVFGCGVSASFILAPTGLRARRSQAFDQPPHRAIEPLKTNANKHEGAGGEGGCDIREREASKNQAHA